MHMRGPLICASDIDETALNKNACWNHMIIVMIIAQQKLIELLDDTLQTG